MKAQGVNKTRRRVLVAATSLVGAVGTGYVLVPFVSSMNPSARARAAGAPIEADIGNLEPGALLRVKWRGQPVWVVHRTPEMLEVFIEQRSEVGRPEVRDTPAARVLPEPHTFHQAGVSGCNRDLHPPGLLADLPAGSRPRRHGRRLEGRFLLPLPRLAFRSGSAGVQERPGAHQSGDPEARLSRQHHTPDRRRRQPGLMPAERTGETYPILYRESSLLTCRNTDSRRKPCHSMMGLVRTVRAAVVVEGVTLEIAWDRVTLAGHPVAVADLPDAVRASAPTPIGSLPGCSSRSPTCAPLWNG